jgi:hypothetical protein
LPLVKPYLLNDATWGDPFVSEYFVWVDADIGSALGDPRPLFTDACQRNLATMLRDDRLLMVGAPLADTAPGPRLAQFAAREPRYVVNGRLFGGTRPAVSQFMGAYDVALTRMLRAGFLRSEDEIFTVAGYELPQRFSLHRLGAGGLRAFFDDLQARVPERSVEFF